MTFQLDDDPDVTTAILETPPFDLADRRHRPVETKFGPFADKVQAIPDCPSAEEWKALSKIVEPARNFDMGANLVSTGNAASHIHILIEGWACRTRTTEDGRQSITCVFLPGDIVDIGALITRENAECVQTITSCRIISLPLTRLRALKRRMPGLANMFLALALAENFRLGEWLRCLGRQSSRQRLAYLFCELVARLGIEVNGGEVRLPLPFTQSQLADIVGLTQVHVNRVLTGLRRDGLVDARGRQLVIMDHARLRRIGEFDTAHLYGENGGRREVGGDGLRHRGCAP
ncbi:MAG: Crp/Fnr family transcriptional regulator [Pacificimonas sp.]